MRRIAGILILSLLLQLVMPMTVSAAETGMDDVIAAMEFEEEVPLKAGGYNAQNGTVTGSSVSNINTENAIEIEGFIQEKYYKREDGYALFIGAAMPEWNAGTTQLTNVAYQIDGGSMTVLGTVASDKFAYDKPTWSNEYGGCLTLSLDSKPANATVGAHTLNVYFTIGEKEYMIVGKTELVDEWIAGEGTAWKWGGEVEYISSRKGVSIEMLYARGYTFQQNEKWTKLQLVPSGTREAALSASARYTDSSSTSSRYCMFYTNKNGLKYSLDEKVIPKEYEIYGWFGDITLANDIADGYYDVLVFTSSGRVYREKKAYYASGKPIIYNVSRKYYREWYNDEKDQTVFSDDTGNYVSVFVYGLNLGENNIPTFYNADGNKVLAKYVKEDSKCGYKRGNKWGNFYSLKKVSTDMGLENYVDGCVIVDGDVLYASGAGHCETKIGNEGIYFTEYLENGKLYDNSSGRVRIYIGEGVNCNVGDLVTYEMLAFLSIDKMPTYKNTAVVQKNLNGKYIEFNEESIIYKNWQKEYSFKLIKGNTILSSHKAEQPKWDINIHSADALLVPSGCSWELHAIGEITKTLYSGTNTSSNTASVLTNAQLSKLAQMGTVRVCIYNADGTVKERKLVYFQHDDSIISFPINVENFSDWQVKVVDSKGKPVQDAEVTYRRQTKMTSEKGIVTLTDYVPGSSLSISKSGYVTYTVDPFVKDPTGCTTCRLLNAGGTFEYAYMTLNGIVTDLLTKEATINTYYSTTEFSINYKVYGTYETCELYSGKKKIAESSDGKFSNLRFKSLQVGEPVYLSVKWKQAQSDKIRTGIQVINLDPKVLEFSIGDDMSIKAPDQIPVIGGRELQIDLGTLPVQTKISADDKIQIGINVTELAKKEKDWFSTLKKMNKNNLSKYLVEAYEDDTKGEIKPKFKVMGYLEGPITNSDYLKGKLLVEFSVSYNRENQYSIVGVPVVVEVSIAGKVNADGSITFTAEQGFSGGTLKVGGEIGAGLYGGVGLAKVASAGVYGEAAIGLQYDIFPVEIRGVNKFYVTGNAGVKVKILGKDVAKHVLIDGTWNIINNDTSVTTLADNLSEPVGYEVNNDAVYADIDRAYLRPDGTMPEWTPGNQNYADGSINESVLQSATCLDIVPQVIRMGDTVMLFYLTDAGTGRDAADRSILVYSIWNKTTENWSEPKAVLDDGTADYEPDLYTDGTKIYAVWQNAKEGLTEEMSLNEIADSLTLHAAVYDKEKNEFLSLGSIESVNGLFQQNPQIVADGDNVSVYWYENEQDNVLGLSGTNKIYQAVLQDTNAALDKSEIQSVVEEDPDIEDIDMEDMDAEDAGAEDLDVEESDAEDIDVEDFDTKESEDRGIFRKYVAVGPETGIAVSEKDKTDESVSGNTSPDETEPEETEASETTESEETEVEETVSENTISEETVSENTISENTIQNTFYGAEDRVTQPWVVTFLQDETECIVNADAGRSSGRIGYAYVAGKLDNQYDVSQGKMVLLVQGTEAVTLDRGALGNVNFTPVYAEETLTWYLDGDIRYIDGNGDTAWLFGESRLPSPTYALLTDEKGSPEILFPVNLDGKSNLYRISYENGGFLPALQVTDQEDYIQYADGFIDDGRTILVYNKMEVNDALEEVNNSLCMGTLMHSYRDIVMQNAGSMIRQDTETGEDVLEITAQLYNNGTDKVEGLSLSLAKSDGTVLETVAIDALLMPGETEYGTAVFSLDSIKEEAEYTVTVSGVAETNLGNNSGSLVLGEASLQVDAELIAVADTREMHVGIQNTGVTSCGGTVSVRDAETGVEYCSSAFEPISAEQTAFAQIDIDTAIFTQKNTVALEVVVTPDAEGLDAVYDFVTAYSPTYAVSFVTDTEESIAYVSHGEHIDFPENPAKEGAYFAGWYDAQDLQTGTLYTEETPITEDVTLYACFVQEQTSIPLENCSVSEIPTQLYTGRALKPVVTVKWGSEVLKANRDYTVRYQNNKEQGTASVTVTGKGKYTGNITKNFLIKYAMNKVSVNKIPAVNFTGENHTPDVTVTYNKRTLVKNTDYTVTYINNRNAGTAGITLTGKGKYSGTRTVTFQIRGTAITGMVFEKIPDVPYNGSATRPIVTIKTKDGTQLQAGADYRLVYENTVNKGTASVTVVGNGNYTGAKKLTYKVVAKPLTEAMISGIEDAVYTGSPIKPTVIVKDGGAALAAGKDYTVSYNKNKAVGTATVTVKGKGNYSGTVKLPFTIRKCSLEDNAQISVQVSDIAYTGKAVKPKVQVYEGSKKLPASGYSLSYANNIEMGTGTVTITGKGNCIGTRTAQFRIVEKTKLITSLKVNKIADEIYTGTAIEPDVTVTDGTYTLIKDMDYKLSYKNQYNVGKATVTIKGIGSYAGCKDLTYKIGKRAVGNRTVLEEGFEIGKIPDEKYTGYALKPDVIVKDHGKTLELGKDYKLSYRKNMKIGTASVALTGIGNYNGSYSAISFNIVGWNYNDLQAEIEDQVYTGKALKPQVAFYHNGENIALKSGTVVKITYAGNKNAGTATATIIGKGELKDMTPITVRFEIEPADIADAVVGRIPNQTMKGAAVKPVPKVKVGKNTLKAKQDFTLSYLRNGVKGEAEVIIIGTGNYAGECRKSFVVQ